MPFSQSDLTAIDVAIASGALEVRFQDRSVRYNSIKDLMMARTLIVAEMNINPPINRQIRMVTSNGF